MRGHETIVNILLNINPQLARDLDSQKWSALHFAAAQGNIRITRKLLTAAPEMCWSLDCQGMNPIHVAAVRGHVEIVRELLQQDYLPAALERAHRGQTVMHLCVKHGQLAALKVLVKNLGEFRYAVDDYGETVLHWAVRCKQVEIIRYLVENSPNLETGWRNSKGKTVLDILKESPKDRVNLSMSELVESRLLDIPLAKIIFLGSRKTIMTVMILVASMAFAAIISPPGGVWQEDSSQHRAGQAVMAYNHPHLYEIFIEFNSTAFVSSILAIFLTATGLGMKAPIIPVAIYSSVSLSLLTICCSYGASIAAMTPGIEKQLALLLGRLFFIILFNFVASLGYGVALSLRFRRWDILRWFVNPTGLNE